MGKINYNTFMDDEHENHRRIADDEIEYLNEGKGCLIWSIVLLVVVFASACIICYNIWEGK